MITAGIGKINNCSFWSLFQLLVRLKVVILFYKRPDLLLSLRQMSLSFQCGKLWRRKRLGRSRHGLDTLTRSPDSPHLTCAAAPRGVTAMGDVLHQV